MTMTGNMLATGEQHAALALTGGVDTTAGATSMLSQDRRGAEHV